MLDWASTNWHEFHGWAVAQGIRPLRLGSTEFVDLVYYFLIKDLDHEGKTKFDAELESINSQEQYKKGKATEAAKPKPTEPEITPEGKKVIKSNLWKAPPGWKPPGWSDEAAYKNSLAGMGGINSTGGGKLGGIK